MLKPPALRGSTSLHFLQSIAVLEAVWRTAQGLSFLPNRKLVFVVDDDPGMLRGVKRLLREYGYDSVLFASAEAFQNQNDFEKALCVILDINLNDGSSGIELRHRLKSCEHFRAGHLHDWKRQPRRFARRRFNLASSPISQSRSRRSRSSSHSREHRRDSHKSLAPSRRGHWDSVLKNNVQL
jgi:response regulator RpfG family c-di-GMP phosphodiesterase